MLGNLQKIFGSNCEYSYSSMNDDNKDIVKLYKMFNKPLKNDSKSSNSHNIFTHTSQQARGLLLGAIQHYMC